MAETSLSDFYEQVYRPHKHRGRSDQTVHDYRVTIRGVNDWWRSLDPDRRAPQQVSVTVLTDDCIGGYLLSRSELGAATRNKQLRSLKAIARLAARKGLIAEPLSLAKEPEVRRKPRCWSQEEVSQLLEAAAQVPGMIGDVRASFWWPALILTAYAIGARISAIMSIRVEDLDLEQGTVLVRGESQKDREDLQHTLIPEAVAALKAIRPQGRLTRVFEEWPHDRDRRTLQHRKHGWRTLLKHFRRIVKAAGLPTTRRDMWHKLRRTFVTEVARAAGLAVAQSMAGHSTPQVTKCYIDERFVELPSAAAIIRRPTVPIQLRLFKPGDSPPPDPPPEAKSA